MPQIVTASARDGGIAVYHKGLGDIWISVGDLDDPQTLRAYARELDVTEQALRAFSVRLGESPDAKDSLAIRLERWARRYHRILDDLHSLRPDNEGIKSAQSEAIAAVKAGELDRADTLLKEAEAIWRSTSEKLLDRADEAATTGMQLVLSRAEIAVSRLQYREAMLAFEEASSLLPQRLNSPLARCLRAWGIAEFEWGRFGDSYAILARARQLDPICWSRDADAMSFLGSAARELGMHKEARQALQIASGVALQPLEQARLRIELAAVLRECGDFAEANEVVEEAAAIASRCDLQPTHRIRLEREAGKLFDELGNISGALLKLERALSQARDQFAPEHPIRRRVTLDYAGMLRRAGRVDESEALYRELEAAMAPELSPAHPELVTILDHLGSLYLDRARFDEAAKILERGCKLAEERLARDHPDRAQVINNHGRALLNLGQFELAAENFELAAKIFDWKFGPGHKDRATALANRAVALFGLGRLDEAVEQANEALALREKALGTMHPDVASSLASLGSLLHQRDELDEAENLFLRAKKIYEAIAPDHSADFSQLLFNLASLYLDRQDFGRAAELAGRAVSLALPVFGEDHPTTVQFFETLGLAEALSGQGAKGRRTLSRANAAASRLWGDDHPVARRLQMLLRRLFPACNNTEAAG